MAKKPKNRDEEMVLTLQAYASFFHNSESGPRILADLKKALDGPSFRPGMDALTTAWLEGRRSVYLLIVAAVGAGVEAIESAGAQPETETEENPMVTGGVLTSPLD